MAASEHTGSTRLAEDVDDDLADAQAYGLYQALPLDGSDPDGLTDAELYLKQVRYGSGIHNRFGTCTRTNREEARQLPFVVTSATAQPARAAADTPSPLATPPTDPALLPDAAWVATFLAQFDALRAAIIQGARCVLGSRPQTPHTNHAAPPRRRLSPRVSSKRASMPTTPHPAPTCCSASTMSARSACCATVWTTSVAR